MPSEQAFWDFSLALYDMPGVKDACLVAQDHHGADVNLLLLLAWHDRAGLRVSDDLMDQLVAVSQHWRQHCLAPHRARRRAAKGTEVYATLLKEELALEREAQAALLSILGATAPDDMPSNTRRYLTRLSAPEELLTPLLAAIRRA